MKLSEIEQKKRRFRELIKDDRICTASELAVNLAQPFLPLFNECPDVQRKEKRPAWRGQSGAGAPVSERATLIKK